MPDGEIIKDNKKTLIRQLSLYGIAAVFLLSLIFFYAHFFISLSKHPTLNDIPSVYRHINVEVGEHSYQADVADTPVLRELGLSFRKGLGPEEGMLFVFEKSGVYPFWMKDMSFPIDILWLDEEGVINFIVREATPASYPHVFAPNASGRFVLEVPAGRVEKENVQIGDKIIFDRPALK